LSKAILKEGEHICNKCKGKGTISVIKIRWQVGNMSEELRKNEKCLNCNGKGKLDWIEHIVGKQI